MLRNKQTKARILSGKKLIKNKFNFPVYVHMRTKLFIIKKSNISGRGMFAFKNLELGIAS